MSGEEEFQTGACVWSGRLYLRAFLGERRGLDG
jgi:hypothetical protein